MNQLCSNPRRTDAPCLLCQFVHACAWICVFEFMNIMHIFPSLDEFCSFPQAEYIAHCVYLTHRTLHCNPTIDFPLTPSALPVWLSQFYRPRHCCEKKNKHKYFTFVASAFTVCFKFSINIQPFEPELDYWWTSEQQIRAHVESNDFCLITWTFDEF